MIFREKFQDAFLMILKYGEREKFMQGLKLGMLTYVHFCVDLACAFWVNYIILLDGTQVIPGIVCGNPYGWGNRLFWLILYNFCAFVLQLPLGMLSDCLRWKKPWRMAALGCVIIGVAGVMAYWQHYYYHLSRMTVMSLLLGLGNALFHVGAGVRVLQMGEKVTPLGIFVSTGTFGVYLGSLFCNMIQDEWGFHGCLLLSIILLSFLAAVVLILGSKIDLLKMPVHESGGRYLPENSVHKDGQGYLPENSVHKGAQKGFVNAVSIFFLFLIVVLRSFQGSFVHFSWRTGILITLLFALCIVAGKVLGGILADRFGLFLALLPLFLSVLLFLQWKNMLFGLGAVLLFQTTMPITLSLLHKQLPALPGTAFGLLSFALFVGYFPKFLFRHPVFWYGVTSGKGYFYKFCVHGWRWWVKHQEAYVYSIVAGISVLLFMLLLCLCYSRREKG